MYFALSQKYDMLDLNEKPLSFGLQALEKASDEMLVDKAWELYLVLLPNWDSKNRMSFNDFLNKARRKDSKPEVSTISKTDMERYADIANLQRYKS
jgi:hypothetical protein